MPIKKLMCSALIISLVLSGCVARESFHASGGVTYEGSVYADDSGGDILLGATLLVMLLPVYLLLHADDHHKGKKGGKHTHGRGRHR